MTGHSLSGQPIYAPYCGLCRPRYDGAYKRRNREKWNAYQREYRAFVPGQSSMENKTDT